MGITRRRFLQQAGGAAVAAGLGAGARAAKQTRQNIIVVLSDEHNPKFTAVHGHPMVQTPNLDRMAQQGTWFENCYCPSPLCMPCRSSFMSGRRVHEIQCYDNCNAIQFEYPSYGQVLGEQGVHAVHIGKTDVYRPTAELGFAETYHHTDRNWPGDTNFRRDPLAVREDGARRANGYGPKDEPFRFDVRCTDEALRWLSDTAPTLDRPWTLVVNLIKPHFPHKVTHELWDLYPDGDDLPQYGTEAASAQHPYAQDLRKHFQTEQFSDADIRGLRRGYLGCVTFIDRQVGKIMEAMDNHGLNENTVLAYTSDHGEMLGKFGMWWKCSLYEDSARVPLMVTGPGFDGGGKVTTPVDLLDVQATLFRCTGAERPGDWTGTPLQDIAKNDGGRFVFAEYHGHGVRSGGYLIRQGDWKLLYNMAAPDQLFNLAEDPEELTNLAERHPAKFKALEEALRSVCDPEKENARAHAFEEKQWDTVQRS